MKLEQSNKEDPTSEKIHLDDRIAAIVVDLQNDYVDPSGGLASTGLDWQPLQGVIPAVNELTAKVRNSGGRVIFLTSNYTDSQGRFLNDAMRRHAERRWKGLGFEVPFVREGHWGSQLAPNIERVSSDEIVVKRHFDGFYDSSLGEVLAAGGRTRTLLMTGITTDICVMFTAQEAFQRGYDVVVPEECVAAYEQDRHISALKVLNRAIGNVVSSNQLVVGR